MMQRDCTDSAALTVITSNSSHRPGPSTTHRRPYVQAQLRAIVGFEIEILDIVGKFKASQNKSDADRAGIRDVLESRHVEGVTELVRSPDGALPESGSSR